MMRKNIIWELFKINILYSNPQAIRNLRQRQEKRPKQDFQLYKAVLKQNLIMVVAMTFLYGGLFSVYDYKDSPNMLATNLTLFVLMGFGTLIGSLYSVFYESKDTALYISLPLGAGEVYVAKLLSALTVGLAFILPALVSLVVAYWQITTNPLSILLAVVNFIFLFATVTTVSILFNHYTGKLISKSRYKKFFSIVFSALPLVFVLLGVVLINIRNAEVLSQSNSGPTLPYFSGFYTSLVEPFGVSSLVNYWLPILLVIFGIYIIVKKIIPNYFNDSTYKKVKETSRHKAYKDSSLDKLMVKHHLSTLKDRNLITQIFIFPIVMIFSIGIPALVKGGSLNLASIGNFWGVALFMGFFLGVMFMLQSFVSVSISLERENYAFIKTLPLALPRFIRQKFWVHYLAQNLPVLVFIILIPLFLKIYNPIFMLCLALGYIASSLLRGQFAFAKDFRHPEFHWQDTTQLLSRSNQWFIAFIMIVQMVLLIAGCILLFVLSYNLSLVIVNSVTIILILAIYLACQYYLYQSFWKDVFAKN